MTEGRSTFDAIVDDNTSYDVEYHYDPITLQVFDVNAADGKPLPTMYLKIRRDDRSGNLRQHDGRLVSSHVDLERGVVEIVTELSDIFVTLENLCIAAATKCLRDKKSFISLRDRDVIAIAIKNIS